MKTLLVFLLSAVILVAEIDLYGRGRQSEIEIERESVCVCVCVR